MYFEEMDKFRDFQQIRDHNILMDQGFFLNPSFKFKWDQISGYSSQQLFLKSNQEEK